MEMKERAWMPTALIRARLGFAMREAALGMRLEGLRRAGMIDAGPDETWRLV